MKIIGILCFSAVCTLIFCSCSQINVPEQNLKAPGGILTQYKNYVSADKTLTDMQKKDKINEAQIYINSNY